MPTDQDDDEWTPAGSLSHDGQIEGLQSTTEQPRGAAPERPAEAPIELMEPERKEPLPEEEPPPPRRPSPWGAIATGIAVLLICAAPFFSVPQKPQLPAGAPEPPAQKLAVPLEPGGAP